MSSGEGDGDADEDQPYFVHGTTTALWQGGVIDATRGGGEFGGGFYAFEDTRWGREAASVWSRKKAYSDGGEPILVRVRIGRRAFALLDREDIAVDALDAVYRAYAPIGRTGKSLVVGSVGRKDVNGRRVANKRLPLQYKFAGGGIAALAYDDVIRVR